MSWRNNNLNKFKPAVSRLWLLALAGLCWSLAGIILCQRAYHWLASVSWSWAVSFGMLGVVLALAVYRLGFSKIAQKNVERLYSIPGKPCIFAFQAWKSYLVIGIMIALGIILRRSPIPRYYLAIIYTAMGGALFLSSFHYYASFWRR